MANCDGITTMPLDTFNTKPTKPHITWEQAIAGRVPVKQPDGSIRYVKRRSCKMQVETKWIDIKTEKPPQTGYYLVYASSEFEPNVYVLFFNKEINCWFSFGRIFDSSCISHWQNLPNPPIK